MRVTVFGSCRQHSLKNYYNVTNIQEHLTYPHYTKEIIQAIEFCKGINNNLNTKLCFRSGILNKKELLPEYFTDEFNSTDVFVLEIASRISYEYNGMFVHHILTENEYGFSDIPNIKIRNQTDIEIEEDLYKIRELLHPKPFIVVSHIYTKKLGKRYELINLLRDITSKMGIPFMSPSDILKEQNVYENEQVLMHFNNLGHELIGKEYYKQIENIVSPKGKILRNVYYTDNERIQKRTFHGIGDFIRGCIAIYNICAENNKIFQIDFSHHAISKFLHSKSYISLEETKNVKYIFPGAPECSNAGTEGFHTETNIFSNLEYTTIDDKVKQFIIDNALTPRIAFLQDIESMMDRLGIQKNEYHVIHIRLEDRCINDCLKFEDIYHKIQNEDLEHSIVISSCYELIKFLNMKNIKTSGLQGCHLGIPSSENLVKNTLLELFLIINAKSIKQVSDYNWGSGFSEIGSRIYNIPIIKI